MRLQSQRGDEPEINITSLIDVVFLLLIFFMVSTTFERQAALKIDLPEASVAAEQAEPVEKLELVIDREGRMYLNDRALTDSRPATIEAAFREAVADDRSKPVLLRADSLTPHHFVVTAMDVTGQLGFERLSIATEQVAEAGKE